MQLKYNTMKQFYPITLMALAFMVSCNNGIGPTEDPDGLSKYKFLSKDAPKSLTKADIEKVAKVNTFAFSLGKEIDASNSGKSYVFSPLSMACLLGMLSEGAAGDTRSEICSALGYGDDGQQEINTFFRNLIVFTSGSASEGEEFSMANIAVLNESIKLLESYRKSVKNYYDADAVNKDFAKEDIAAYINEWASQKTNGRIKKVLDKVECLAYFMDALYFKGSWASPFNEKTKEEVFTCANGETRMEKMMWQRKEHNGIPYTETSDYQAVNLFYGNSQTGAGNYSMSVILPKAGKSVSGILSSLNGEGWSNLQRSFKGEYVDLKLPRFDISLDKDMKPLLKNIGIKTMFDGGADFSRMSDNALSVSMIKQVANISVDEKGTEAAAVSIAGVRETADKGEEGPEFINFHADHPFLFAITEKTTGAILFLGCYQ